MQKAPHLVIYGATGYSGRLIVQHALSRGLRPVIAGRNPCAVAAMAAEFGLEWRAARLDDLDDLRSLTASAGVLLNAAGPFATTSGPLIAACITMQTHYLDITGELGVIEAAMGWHGVAIRRGVMLMPAVGFEVVASDCLAAHVCRRLPRAAALKLGFGPSQSVSRGSLKTAVELSAQGVMVRRQAKLVRVAPGSLAHHFDYGHGPQLSLAVSSGDLASAYFSTGIPDIETYISATLPVYCAITANQYWGWLLSMPAWQTLLKAQTDWLVPNPSPNMRNAGWNTLVAEATDAGGRCVRSRLRTGDAYSFTAMSAVGIAVKCLAGEWKPGFQTPSRMYGADFALSFDAVSREEI
jgi:short subunit dehydrogenase-like uncharacterized protein